MKLCASALLSFLVACGGSPKSVDANVVSAPTPHTRLDHDASGATPNPTPAPEPDRVAPASVALAKTIAAANNKFGLDLWQQLSKENSGNLAVSPASLAVAFAMTYAGARGVTADEMAEVLHLAGVADVHAAAGALMALWGQSGKPYALAVANRLFGEATAQFEPPFLDRMKSAYGAPLELVDFLHDAEAQRTKINAWVAAATQDRIKDLLPPQSLDELTRLVLVNAIYFKGAWKSKFDVAATTNQNFASPGGAVSVPFMHGAGAYRIGGDEDVQVLELPYAGNDLAMSIVLPRKDLTSLEPKMTNEALERWFASVADRDEVDVFVPRFKITTGSLPLKPALKALGMRLAFTGDADFKNMATSEKLFIDDAFHKVFVEVNEEGTEAAAATAVVMTRESAHEPMEFRADKPFLFFVRDLRTGHILFMGRVTNPA